jgi:predicted exporter
MFYSDYASQQAKRDISTLGVATILGVILLIVATFRSLRRFCCALSLSPSARLPDSRHLAAFRRTSSDDAGHEHEHYRYLCRLHALLPDRTDGTRRARHTVAKPGKVRKTLLLALLTTVAAYLIMMLAPFPGIRQMAVFAACGLSAACLTVIFWHPWLCRGLPVRPVPAMALMLRWLAAWRRNKTLSIGLPTALALFSLAGLSRLHVDDDIAQLQALPQSILAQEKAITRLTGQSVDQKVVCGVWRYPGRDADPHGEFYPGP